MNARSITDVGYAGVKVPSSLGRPPRLEWLAIAQLVVDSGYQRDITTAGRSNVRRIASGFDWSMFAPVIVAPAGGDTYAIVDGQHRTTAALLCGLQRVPCAIIAAERDVQARAFRAINGNVTRIHTVHLHHASVAAGDVRALAIADLCAKAGVTIVRNPTQASLLKPGETVCVAVIGKAMARFGADAAVLGLKTIVSTGGGNPGLLNATIIWGVVEVLHDHPEWRAHAGLNTAFDAIDLDEIWRKATASAARLRGTSAVDQFEGLLVEALQARLGNRGARK